jgi:hypothetical protein
VAEANLRVAKVLSDEIWYNDHVFFWVHQFYGRVHYRPAGFRCLTVEIHRSEIDTLIRHGLLGADERDDEGAVVDALSQYIEQTIGSANGDQYEIEMSPFTSARS